MRNIFKIIAIICISFNCKAQAVVDISTFNQGDNANKYFKDVNNHFANFTGTWENTTGNITFRVTLWKVSEVQWITETNCFMDEINGSYKIIQNAGMANEVILHNSVKYYAVNDQTSSNIMWIRTSNGIGAGGSIVDNCTLPTGTQLSGFVTIKITNSGVAPSIAHWTVKRGGIRFTGDPTFTVPTDIILTKVN